MKSKMLGLGIAAVALVGLVGGGAAYAHGRFGHGGFMKAAMEKRIADAEEYVQATPAQRKVIEGARDAIEAKMKAHFDARKAEHEKAGAVKTHDPHDVVGLLSQDKIDEQALYAEIDRRADEMKAMAREMVPEIIKAHDALTSEQRQKLAARATERREKMKQHWQEHQGERGGFGGPDQQ